MKNTGKPYESLTQRVFERLLAQAEVVTNVERDVVVEGRSTSHQLDVTFVFTVGPATYRTIVQCKDWRSAVKQEQVLAFHSVLTDIPGQPRGIMVSRSGFQEGARKVAEHHGIKLYELREPRDEDWDGRVRTIVLTVHVTSPSFDEVNLVADEDAVRKDAAVLGVGSVAVAYSGHPAGMPLTYASGAPYDLGAILNSLVPVDLVGSVRIRHEFEEPVFAEIPGSPIPRVAIKAVEALVSVHKAEPVEIRINIDHLISYCFRDVLEGEVRFLGADGGPVRNDGPSGQVPPEEEP
jgi:hypothetical protein